MMERTNTNKPTRRTTPCFPRLIPFLISFALTSNDNILSFGVVVSAFAPPRPTRNVILRGSGRGSSSHLYGLLDSLGGVFSGPKLEAEKNLPYDPPFSSDLSISDDARTFAIRERPGEDFDIIDITGDKKTDFVRVRGAMLHLPGKDKMILSSSSTGEKSVIMDRVMIAATPSYNLIRASDGTKIGWMEKKLISFTDSFDVYMEGKGGFGFTGLFKPTPAYRIEGDFLDRNFVFKNEEGAIVARANVDGWVQLDMMNHYQVQIGEGMDALLVLACICCIDEEFDEEHQKRKEERQRKD